MLRSRLALLMMLLAAPAYAGSRFGGGAQAEAFMAAASPLSTAAVLAPVVSLAVTATVTTAASVSTAGFTIMAMAMAVREMPSAATTVLAAAMSPIPSAQKLRP